MHRNVSEWTSMLASALCTPCDIIYDLVDYYSSMCELPRRSYPININSTDWETQIWRVPIFGKGCDVRWRTHLMIRDTDDLRVIIVRVTQCQSRYLFRENFLLGLFHSKENIVTIDNLYLFFNPTHKHLVICFVVKEFELRPLDDCRLSYHSNTTRHL